MPILEAKNNQNFKTFPEVPKSDHLLALCYI